MSYNIVKNLVFVSAPLFFINQQGISRKSQSTFQGQIIAVADYLVNMCVMWNTRDGCPLNETRSVSDIVQEDDLWTRTSVE